MDDIEARLQILRKTLVPNYFAIFLHGSGAGARTSPIGSAPGGHNKAVLPPAMSMLWERD